MKRFIILILFTGLSGQLLADTAGKVIYATGDAYAYTEKEQQKRILYRGDSIYENDTLVTTDGRMQVKLADGGYISLSPKTAYRIDEYRFTGADNEHDSATFTLLRGALRQITGVIGKKHRKAFRVNSVAATIGVRGTGFYTRLCQQDCVDDNGEPMSDGQYVKNETGIISFSNQAGEIILAQGQGAYCENNEDEPVEIQRTSFDLAEARQNLQLFDFDYRQADTRRFSPGSTDLPGNGNTQIFYAVNNQITGNALLTASDSITVSDTIVTAFNLSANNASFDAAGSTLADQGNNNQYGVSWSHWSNPGNFNYSDINGSVVGDEIHIITSDQQIMNSLPTTGFGVYTSILGGTSPTYLDSGNSNRFVGTMQNATIDLNFNTGQVVAFFLRLDFGTNGAIDITDNGASNINIANGSIPLFASCSSATLCNAGLNGETRYAVLGDGSALMGIFQLNGSGVDVNRSASGSYLVGGSIQ